MALLTAHDIAVTFGGPSLFEDVSLTITGGERICLLGRNGSGKTTLLSVLAGGTPPSDGAVTRQRDLRIAALPQDLPRDLSGPAGSVARSLLEHTDPGRSAWWHRDDDAPTTGDPLDTDDADRSVMIEQTMTRLGVRRDAAVETMSGGELRRLLLAVTLAADWDLLILDEPTNHLDLDSIRWLEQELLTRTRGSSRAVIFVTHDRAFSRAVASRVVALDRAALYSFPGSYDDFIRRKEAAAAAEEQAEAEFDRTLAAEEAWLRRGVKARRTRNEGRVRALEAMREAYAARRRAGGTARLRIAEAERSGTLVAEATDASFAFTPDSPIVSGLETTILAGDRVGIVGPNGVGKTTVVRLLLGELEPGSGSVRRGTGLRIAYFDQLRAQIDLSQTVYDAFGEGYDSVQVGTRRVHTLAYMQDFLFSPDDRNRPLATLSGGERNRVLLARLFARPSNVLVLDEPTNDLDQETLELLEDRLAAYTGTVLLVSHDREFLDNVVTDCLVMPGGGIVAELAGGYHDWAAQYEELRASVRRAEDRGAGRDRRPPTGAAAAESEDSRRNRDRRLSFKERRELEILPDRIEALETEQETIHTELADPALYRTDDGRRTAELTARLRDVEAELNAAFERWEELSALE